MTICDSCRAHVARRNKANGILHLINLPQYVLKSMTVDQLREVRSIAQNGAMLCSDCIKLCRSRTAKGNAECPANLRPRKIQNAIRWRRIEDLRVIRAIDTELTRRKNLLLTRLRTMPVAG